MIIVVSEYIYIVYEKYMSNMKNIKVRVFSKREKNFFGFIKNLGLYISASKQIIYTYLYIIVTSVIICSIFIIKWYDYIPININVYNDSNYCNKYIYLYGLWKTWTVYENIKGLGFYKGKKFFGFIKV